MTGLFCVELVADEAAFGWVKLKTRSELQIQERLSSTDHVPSHVMARYFEATSDSITPAH